MHKLYQNREDYLRHAQMLTDEERGLITDFENWLPKNIIDAHSHSNLSEHVDDIPNEAFNHMLSTFPSFTIEESRVIQRLLHPSKSIRSLRFPNVFRGIDHKAANDFLLRHSTDKDRVAIFGLPEDIAYTVDALADPRVAALKMYYSYLRPPATKIYQIFKPRILEAAESTGKPIVLHTPRVITESFEEVITLHNDFPDLAISIAHLGSSKFDLPELQDAYDALAEGTNVMLDTALNPSLEVCVRALKVFGSKRIMFGSDEPLNLIRSVPYVHPEIGQRIVASYPYHWVDPQEHEEYGHLANGAVHSHWLSLLALRGAISNLPETEQESTKQNVFHDNAQVFYGFE